MHLFKDFFVHIIVQKVSCFCASEPVKKLQVCQNNPEKIKRSYVIDITKWVSKRPPFSPHFFLL